MTPLELFDKSINEKLTIAEKAWLINQTEKYPYFSVLHFIQARNASADPRKDRFQAMGAIYATDRLRYADFLQANPMPVLEPLPELIEYLPATTTIEKKEFSHEENSLVIEKNKNTPAISTFSAATFDWQDEAVNLSPELSERSSANNEELLETASNSLKKEADTQELFASLSYPSESSSPFIPTVFDEINASKHISLRLERLLNIARSVYQSLYWAIQKEMNERFTTLAVDKMLQEEKTKREASTLAPKVDEEKREISSPPSHQEGSFKNEKTEWTNSQEKNHISGPDSLPMDIITPEVDDEHFIWEVSLVSRNASNYSSLTENIASLPNITETLKPIVDESIENKLTNEPISPDLVIDEFIKLYETTGFTTLVPNRVEENDKKVMPVDQEKDWYTYLTQNPIRTSSFNRFIAPDFEEAIRKNEATQLIESKEIKKGYAYLNKNLFADTLPGKETYKNNENIDIAAYDSAGSAALAQFTPPPKKQDIASPSSYSWLPEKITSDSMKRFVEPDFGIEDKKSFESGAMISQRIEVKAQESASNIISVTQEKIPTPVEELHISSSGRLAAPISSDSFKRFVVPDFGTSSLPTKQSEVEASFTSLQQQPTHDEKARETATEISEHFQLETHVLQQWAEASNLPNAEAMQEEVKKKPQKISSPSFQRFVEPDFGHAPTNRPTKKSLQVNTPSSEKQAEMESPLEKSIIQQNSEIKQDYSGKLPYAIRTDSFNRFVEPEFAPIHPTPSLRSAEISPDKPLKEAPAIIEEKEKKTTDAPSPEKKQTIKKQEAPKAINYTRKNIAFEIIIKPEHSHLINTQVSSESLEVKSGKKESITNVGNIMASDAPSTPLAPTESQQSLRPQSEDVKTSQDSLIVQDAEKSIAQEKDSEATLEDIYIEKANEEKAKVGVAPPTKSVAENITKESILTPSGQDTVAKQNKLQNVANVNVEELIQAGLKSAPAVDAIKEIAQPIQSEQGWEEEPSFFENIVNEPSASSFVLDFLEEEDYNISAEALLASNIDERIDNFRKNLDKIRRKKNPLINTDLSLLDIQQKFLEGIAQSMTKQRQSAASFIEDLELAEQIDTPPPPEHLKNSKSIDDLLERFSKFEPTIYQNIENKNFIPSSFSTFQIYDSDLTEEEESDYVTETLAKIHVKQGNNDKAIKIYKKLKLKFPEKSSYFEGEIQKLLASS
jgi:hypothetical protein